jgi:hypothetical protein
MMNAQKETISCNKDLNTKDLNGNEMKERNEK